MSAEQLYDERAIDTVDEAITRSGIERILIEGVYRPDVAQEFRMRRIQVELAVAGVPTTLSTIHQRGRAEPLSYELRRLETEALQPAARLDDYR